LVVGTSPGLGFYRLIRSIGRRLETLSRTDIDQRNPPPGITLPDIVGQNAGGVEDRLRGLGVTSVELSFATPEYKSVWAPSNWTVVSTDRPLAAWSTATTAWWSTSRSDRRIPASVTSVPRTFFAHSKHQLCTLTRTVRSDTTVGQRLFGPVASPTGRIRCRCTATRTEWAHRYRPRSTA